LAVEVSKDYPQGGSFSDLGTFSAGLVSSISLPSKYFVVFTKEIGGPKLTDYEDITSIIRIENAHALALASAWGVTIGVGGSHIDPSSKVYLLDPKFKARNSFTAPNAIGFSQEKISFGTNVSIENYFLWTRSASLKEYNLITVSKLMNEQDNKGGEIWKIGPYNLYGVMGYFISYLIKLTEGSGLEAVKPPLKLNTRVVGSEAQGTFDVDREEVILVHENTNVSTRITLPSVEPEGRKIAIINLSQHVVKVRSQKFKKNLHPGERVEVILITGYGWITL
jgi:hypothetical protein